MADKVRANIERFIPDLLAFQRKDIFAAEEVQQIIKAREANEYLLQRKNVRLKDFLRVLEYEYALERRRLKQSTELKLKKMNDSDYSIVKRILQLWDRIMNKFRYDLSLWKQYLGFCYTIRSKKQFNKAVTHALSLLPYEIDLWLLAAYFEFETQSNPFKARKIFYRALKLLGSKETIWNEYISFELQFLQKVHDRQEFLAVSKRREEGFLAFKEQEEGIEIEMADSTPGATVIRSLIGIAFKRFPSAQFKTSICRTLGQSEDAEIQQYRAELVDELLNETQIEDGDVYCQLLLMKHGNEFSEIIAAVANHEPKQAANVLEHLLPQIPNEQWSVVEQQIFAKFPTDGQIQSQVAHHIIKNKLSINEELFDRVDKLDQRLPLLLELASLECTPEIYDRISQTLWQIVRSKQSLSKLTKHEILTLLLKILSNASLAQTNLGDIYSIGKAQLINNQELFGKFINAFFAQFSQFIEQQLPELVTLKRYCPLEMHLHHISQQPISKQYARLYQLTQLFATDTQAWRSLLGYCKQHCPERLNEAMQEGLRSGLNVDQILAEI